MTRKPRLDDLERIAIDTGADLRRWLAGNHTRTGSVWIVAWKKASGRPHVAAERVRLIAHEAGRSIKSMALLRRCSEL